MMQFIKYIIFKKIISLFLVSALIFNTNQTQTKVNLCRLKAHKTTLYFGQIPNLPGHNFNILYDGEIIEVQDQTFALKDQMLACINLLFVDLEKIHFNTEDSTVLDLTLATNDYKFYQLTATHFPTPSATHDSYSCSWKIVENKINTNIPINCIIIPLSPQDVEISLQNTTGKPSNLAVRLPTINLKTKNNKTLSDLMLESYVKIMAIKPFFTKQCIRSVTENNTKISMIL